MGRVTGAINHPSSALGDRPQAVAPALAHIFPPWPPKVPQVWLRRSLWDAGKRECTVVFTVLDNPYAKFTLDICVTSCFWRDTPSLGSTTCYMPLCAKAQLFPRSVPPFLLRKQATANAHNQCYRTRSPWTPERKILITKWKQILPPHLRTV